MFHAHLQSAHKRTIVLSSPRSSCSSVFQVLLTVDESSMFEFVTSAGDEPLFAGVRHVSVWRQNNTIVFFAIRATQLGQMPISVKAMSIYASDSVSQTILVKVILSCMSCHVIV